MTHEAIDDLFAEVGRIYRTTPLTQLDLEKLEHAKVAIQKEVTLGKIAELERLLLPTNRQFPVSKLGKATDIEGQSYDVVRVVADTWEDAIKLRLKALQAELGGK